ncbi:CaiB/BaiF CoA-transferase family protein [Streptomyces sp. ISL-11]|uniref:CaiB/BaiF CoA transferase family protein n=1 Tax=Streptomyces sp. ISL-11 TaxID=2819174 RepID=UPI001BEB3F06|nr:CaiB/BaiF CoA-transferase family protein [Streptomyces sp. ISL-11]MBT2383745.1 CoA transferase [Streptomyces sp. ISL-11]
MGPLDTLRVVELAGGAPTAYAATLLADLGADVVRIDRPAPGGRHHAADPLGRGRRSMAADLKVENDLRDVRSLIDRADVFLEGMRPGMCERLGLGPDALTASNPRLIYARLSGWGHAGPWAQRPGHDISFLAMAGLLDSDRPAAGPPAPPAPPSTYLSTFAGGGMLQALGILAALHERTRSGRGQVVDAAMVDGAAMLDVMTRQWRDLPGNVTVTDAPFYTTYACQDGLYVAVGAIEPRFYATLLECLALDPASLPDRADEAAWPALRTRLAAAFAEHTRDHWTKVFDEHEACVVPVLNPTEAPGHPALHERGTFVEVAGTHQPAPSPRFIRTPAAAPTPAPAPGEHTAELPHTWRTPAN